MLYEPQKDIMYLRLSEEDDERDESCSIASQRGCIERYLSDRGDLGTDFEEIVDDGYSGTNLERPGMQRLLDLIDMGQVRTVIVRDLSRFARNYLEAGYYLEVVFPTKGIHFIAINDGFDSWEVGEDTGGLELAIRNLVNQMYSRDISRKIKSVVDMKKRNGEYAFGAVPYGYKKGAIHNTIVIDEPAAETVRRIFALAAEGTSITKIALTLNEDQVDTPSVYLASVRGNYKTRAFWTYESVRNILGNRIYTGDTEVFKSHVTCVGSNKVRLIPEELRQVIPETHAAIIPRTTYYLARKAVRNTAPKTPATGKTSPLSSFLVCGCCGNRLLKGKQKNKTWLCASARYTHDTECRQVRMDDQKLREILLRAIQNQCDMVDVKVKKLSTAEKRSGEKRRFLLNELKICKSLVDRAQREKMQLYEQFSSGEVSKDMFITQKNEVTLRQEDAVLQVRLVEEQLEAVEAGTKAALSEIRQLERYTKYAGMAEITPTLVKELVKEIIIYPDNRLRIIWNFRDNVADNMRTFFADSTERA